MGNAIRFLKRHITNIPPEYSDAEAKEYLHEQIDKYIQGTHRRYNFVEIIT